MPTSNKKKLISEENKKEIVYNIINSGLAGGLVFFGSLVSGGITIAGCVAAFAAASIVALTKFKDYWDGEKPEYISRLAVFI